MNGDEEIPGDKWCQKQQKDRADHRELLNQQNVYRENVVDGIIRSTFRSTGLRRKLPIH
jgi:hypothetical protein